jgi:CDP-diacylglycerol--serine O-phosphatidyltransferase
MIVVTIFLYYYLGGEGAPNKQITLLLVIYGLAALMVSAFPYLSLKNADLKKRFPIWMLVFAVILIKVVVMAPQVMFFTLVLLYTLSGPLLWSWTSIQRRRRVKRGEMAQAQP